MILIIMEIEYLFKLFYDNSLKVEDLKIDCYYYEVSIHNCLEEMMKKKPSTTNL